MAAKLRFVWRAKIRIGDRRDEFLFRAVDQEPKALKVATEIFERSPYCNLTGAAISGVERIARIWN